MRNKKVKIIFAILIVAAAGLIYLYVKKRANSADELIRQINPFLGTIQNLISSTGTVLPKNRLEIKPPVNGRVEEIIVQEGKQVKAGEILGWMSSTERAALLDAARGKSEADLKYWQEVYKAIPLISPIDGEVIVATTQPGQTVSTSDPVIVLSDKLIVRAQVDETDIGKIKLGQNAFISLDAYPDTKIKAKVDHIYYESKTVNNVTIYEVDLLPENVPDFFRSGMNATVNFIKESKENILLLPSEAILKGKDNNFVLVKKGKDKEPEKRPVKLGLSDDKNTEIVSGIELSDTVIMKSKKYSLPQNNNNGKNPFMPNRGRGR